jgi:hypothetical protein
VLKNHSQELVHSTSQTPFQLKNVVIRINSNSHEQATFVSHFYVTTTNTNKSPTSFRNSSFASIIRTIQCGQNLLQYSMFIGVIDAKEKIGA